MKRLKLQNFTIEEQLAETLRMVLYVGQIYRQQLEVLSKYHTVKSGLKQVCVNSITKIDGLKKEVLSGSTPANCKYIREELTKEQINDMSLILELLFDVKNVDVIYRHLKEAKKEFKIEAV